MGALRVAITGASGLIGSALSDRLRADGHSVVRMVRRPARAADEIQWQPGGELDPAALEGVDAVVSLAGASIASRWNEKRKRAIRDSRIDGTTTLVRAIAAMDSPPRVFVSASAVGYYGDGGERDLDEQAGRGEGFLASLVEEWEDTTKPLRKAGVRTVILRQGVVLAKEGGALGQALPAFRLGLGGQFADGQMWFSWISLEDDVRLFVRALTDTTMDGVYNAVAPEPVRNADYVKTIGSVLRRPVKLRIPAAALRVIFGELADEGLLISQRVLPARTVESGFTFEHPTLEGALRAELGK
jgi:uncharacterized protein